MLVWNVATPITDYECGTTPAVYTLDTTLSGGHATTPGSGTGPAGTRSTTAATPDTATTSASPSDGGGKQFSGREIAGIVVGVGTLIVITIAICLLYRCIMKGRRNTRPAAFNTDFQMRPPPQSPYNSSSNSSTTPMIKPSVFSAPVPGNKLGPGDSISVVGTPSVAPTQLSGSTAIPYSHFNYGSQPSQMPPPFRTT